MTRVDDGQTVASPDRPENNPDQPENNPNQPDRAVTVHECSPTRRVFTENGNSEGWIATDTTVELQR